jgi:WD40 repeat protein
VDDGKIGLVKVWDIQTKQECGSFSGRELTGVLFTPDGSTLISASGESVVGFDWMTGDPKWTIPSRAGRVTAATVSVDGRSIAVAGDEGIVEIADTARPNAPTISYVGHAGPVPALAFSSDCERLVSAGADSSVRVWDTTTDQRSIGLSFGLEANDVLSPEGQASSSNMLSVYVALSPDGSQYSSASHTLIIRDTLTGRKRLHLEREIDSYSGVIFSPSNEYVATYVRSLLARSGVGTLNVISTASGEVACAWRAHNEPISYVAFGRDPGVLATCAVGKDEPVKLWDFQRQKHVLDFHCEHDGFGLIAFSPDGRQLAGANSDFLVLWDTGTGSELKRYSTGGEPVSSMTFSPDGRYIAVGQATTNPSILVWDLTRDSRLDGLTGHKGDVTSLAFSQEGLRLASGSSDRTVRIWAVLEGREVLTLQGHNETVLGLAFRTANDELLSAATDGTLRIWPVAQASEEGDVADRLAVLRSRSPEWHLNQAQDAIYRKQPGLAALHLRATKRVILTEPLFLGRRSELYAELQQWEDSANDLEQMVAAGHAPPWVWHKLAVFAAHRKQRESYYRICNRFAEHCLAGSPSLLKLVVRTCCLAPHEASESGAEDRGQDWWFKIMTAVQGLSRVRREQSATELNLYGAALCRGGRFEDALKELAGTAEGTYWWGLWNQLFLAIAFASLKKNDDANRIAAGVERILNPGPNESRSIFGATSRLELEILLDEARVLLGGIESQSP